jgi:ABC-type antimicrobial peptide transport system permease subunit
VIFPRGLLAIRASSRAFAHAPALSLALVFTIAIGVGSNASIYGFVQGLTHPDSPLKNTNGIVSILGQDSFHETGPLSRREYQLLKNRLDTFDWIDAAEITPRDIKIGDRTEIAMVADVTSNLARALNLPLRGGIIVSQRMWQSELGSRADVIGGRIRINSLDLPITGVAPSQLVGLYSDQTVDIWMPSQDERLQNVDLNKRDLWVLAQLRQPLSISQAQATVRRGFGNSSEMSLVSFTGAPPRMVLGLSRIGTLLNFAAAAVFFVASINVASFLFGRALKRAHETSLRIALGATRAQLMGELLSDSIVIAIAGGALGALLAVCTARVLPALLFEEDAERLVYAPHVLPIMTASILCVCITVMCGMMPVFATVTDRPWIILGRESGMPSKRTERIRNGLVLGQITSCYVLVICAAFLFQGLHSALQTSEGHQLARSVLLTVQAQASPAVDINYFNEVERTAKSVAVLPPMAWTARLPGSQPVWRSFRIQPSFSPLHDVDMDIVWLTTNSLKLLDGRPIAGRMFGRRDPTRIEAVVDEDAAAELFGRESVGMVIQDSSGLPVEIIGVVTRSPAYTSNKRHATIYYNYMDLPQAPNPIAHAHFLAPVSPLINTELSANVVSPSYFNALDLSLIAGRQFPEHQMHGQVRVGIVNQEAADLYFSGKPLGAGITDNRGVRTEIIGVVRSRVLGTFQHHTEPTIYFPMQQDCIPRMTLILDGSKWNARTLADLRRKIEPIPGRDLAAPIEIEALDAQLARSAFAPLRIATLLSSALASLALILSVLGLLSAQGDAERQRRRELALRIALGAQRWRIAVKVMSSAVQLALMGTAIGTLVSLGFLRVLASETAIFSSPAPWVWLMVVLVPTVTVLIASALPALRAAFVDPLTIMRDEH